MKKAIVYFFIGLSLLVWLVEMFTGWFDQTLTETLKHMLDEDSEIVTFYVGEDGSEELANQIAQEIAEEFEDVEVEIHQGQQPVYPYLFSVE